MKKIVLLVIIFFGITSSFGQKRTLKVVYAKKIGVPKALKNITDPALRQTVLSALDKPKNYSLYSKNGMSIYKKMEADNTGNVTITGTGGDAIVYKNRNQNKFVKQVNFLSRYFLMTDTLPKIPWKITDKTQKIGGYVCRKATALIADLQETVWFTSEIPVSDGPENYFGLPGLILKAENKNNTITAKSISFINQATPILAPKRGKKITAKKFEVLKKQKLKELKGDKKTENGVKIIRMP